MKYYTISNEAGKTTKVRLPTHTQHIWHTSEALVSPQTRARVERDLGPGPYGNPAGHFGRAQRIILTSV
jgi:hypothetical protein